MSDSDLIKLYSGRILELAASIPAVGAHELVFLAEGLFFGEDVLGFPD